MLTKFLPLVFKSLTRSKTRLVATTGCCLIAAAIVGFFLAAQHSLDSMLTAASESDSSNLRLGLEKKLVTGGSISPNVRWTRSWTNSTFATLNPNYSLDAYITISQPLLRNAQRVIADRSGRNGLSDRIGRG